MAEAEAVRVGRRAAALLKPSRAGVQAPFTEPVSSRPSLGARGGPVRREGLLYLSLGHSAEAACDQVACHVKGVGAQGALECFRRAAQALQRQARSLHLPGVRASDPAAEGVATLEFGRRLVQV